MSLQPPLISLDKTDLGYGRNVILSGVSFQLLPGEFLGVVGPNGSGKSTLLKTLLGLLSPINGQRILRSDLDKKIGYVPQRDRLDAIFPLTAYDVVNLGLTAIDPWWRLFDSSRKEKVMAALEQVNLLGEAPVPFSELSGGQRQRVLIARALVIEPHVLVLDEPTSGVDHAAEESILTLLSDLNKNHQKTILMVSHRTEKMKSHVTRWLRVEDGQCHE